jgi:Nucleotidyl transferase AbiEii toxin, Type IV TA system
VSERRGKWSVTVAGRFNERDATLSSKLDVSPPVWWLDPAQRGWVAMPVHATYGSRPLPELQVVRMEENLAEKISRLNRTTTARDMYDLAWVAQHQRDIGGLNTDLIRRLAVLKIWVDANGLGGANAVWKPGHEPRAFDPSVWLRTRSAREFDLNDIGALAVPVPTEADLATTVSTRYAFLAELDTEERQLAVAREQDRDLALRMLAELPGGRLAHLGLH